MKGYKAFNRGFICRDMQYEIGKEYTLDGELKMCERGYHFCKNLIDIFGYYAFDRDSVVLAEVEATGRIVQEGTKYCTDKIKIVREVTWEEVDVLIKDNRCNTGNHNSGDYNSGNCNSGYYNSGCYNSGNCNSGYYNSGNHNSGSYNSGNCNSGCYNSGKHNSGSYNSGNCNSGCYNSGNHNSGNCNSGYYNSGFFNSNEPTARLFNKDSGLTFSQIYELHIDWCHLENSKATIQALPNYDPQIFFEATGIDWREENK